MRALPAYFNDPLFGKTQADQYELGSNLLKGNIPEYFRPIGEVGGSELESVIAMGSRDIQKASLEHAAAVGNRGGVSRLGPAVADMTSKLRYADFVRAMSGRESFLNTGTGIIGGVRNAAFGNQSATNDFNLNTTKLGMEQDDQEAKRKAAKQAMYTQILSSAIGAAGTIGGFMIGGPPGAAVGGSLASSAFSAGGDSGAPSLAGFTPPRKNYYNV